MVLFFFTILHVILICLMSAQPQRQQNITKEWNPNLFSAYPLSQHTVWHTVHPQIGIREGGQRGQERKQEELHALRISDE